MHLRASDDLHLSSKGHVKGRQIICMGEILEPVNLSPAQLRLILVQFSLLCTIKRGKRQDESTKSTKMREECNY